MAYRASSYSQGSGLGDPLDQSQQEVPDADAQFAARAALDDSSRAAAAHEQTRDIGIPEESAERGFLDYSLAEHLIALPGQTALEGGLETASARAGELIHGIGGAPQALAELAGQGEWWEENAPEVRDTINETIIKPILGDREIIDKEYEHATWDEVKKRYDSGDYTGVAKAVPSMILKEGLGSIPDMVALMAGPLGWSAYGTARTSEVADERREGGEDAYNSATDVGIAMVTALTSAAIDKVALGSMLNKAGFGKAVAAAQGRLSTRLAAAVGTEAATEAVQEHIEYVGGMVQENFSDFKEFFDSPEDFENALVGAIIGGGVAGGLVGAGELKNRPKVEVTEDGTGSDEKAAVAAATGTEPTPEETDAAINDTGGVEDTTPPIPVTTPKEEEPPEDPKAVLDRRIQGARDLIATNIAVLEDPEMQALDRQNAEKLLPKIEEKLRKLLAEAGIEEEVPSYFPEKEIPEYTTVEGSRMELPQGVMDDGVQDVIAPPDYSQELPPGQAKQDVDVSIKQNQKQASKDELLGRQVKDTGLGQLVEQALTGKASGRDLLAMLEAEETGPLAPGRDQRLAEDKAVGKNAAALERIQKSTAKSKNTPGVKLVEMVDNLALLTHEATTKTQNNKLVAALEAQTDAFQKLSSVIKDAVRVRPDGSVASDEVAGAITRTLPVIKALGFDTTALGKAKTPVEARKALDALGKQVAAEVKAARGIHPGLNLPPRKTFDKAQQEIDPDILNVMGDLIREKQSGGTGGAVTLTPQDKFTEEYEDEDGKVKTRVRKDLGPKQKAQRDAEIQAQEQADRRRQGNYGSFEDPNQYEDVEASATGGEYDRVQPPLISAAYPDGKETQLVKQTPAHLKSLMATLVAERKKAIREKNPEELASIREDIRDVQERMAVADLETVTPDAVAGERLKARDNVKSPASKKARAEAEFAKLAKDEKAIDEAGKKILVEEARLAAAERAVGENVKTEAEKRDALEKKASKEKKEATDKLDAEAEADVKAGKDPEVEAARRLEEQAEEDDRPVNKAGYKKEQKASGTIKDTSYGVSAVRLDAAKATLKRYSDEFNALSDKAKELTKSPSVIVQRMIEAKNHRLGPSGLPSALVLNPKESDHKKALVSVRGVVPRRIITRDKGTGRITKVVRHHPRQPGDPAPFSQLKRRTYYTYDQIEVQRGNRVSALIPGTGMAGPDVQYAALNEADRTMPAAEADAMLVFLGSIDFDWGNHQPDEMAMMQYLAQKTSSKKIVRPTPEQKAVQRAKERLKTPAPATPVDPDEPIDIDDIPDIDWDLFIDQWGVPPSLPEGETVESYYTKLVAEVKMLEGRIATAAEELPDFMGHIRAQVAVGGTLTVEGAGSWPHVGTKISVKTQPDGRITDKYGVVKYPREEGQSADMAMTEAVIIQAQAQITNDVVMLKEAREKLEELNAKRGQATPTGRKKQTGKATPDPTPNGEGPVVSTEDDRDGELRSLDDRIPGSEPLIPGDRVSAPVSFQFTFTRSFQFATETIRHIG